MTAPASPEAPAIFSRNLGLLVAAQALGGASPPIIILLGGLVGQQLSSNPTLSTLPVSIYQLGLALSTLPVAWLMQRSSRRTAYVLGAVLGVVSGLVAARGIAQSNFVLFCLGTALAGFYAACVQSYRFAATDGLGEQGLQARAISLVMFGPSFFTGRLIARFGKHCITALGLLLIAAALLALAGLELLHFWGALILLGVGWISALSGPWRC